MNADIDLFSLSVRELVSLVKELHQQLDEKNREIERLQQRLTMGQGEDKEENAGIGREAKPAPGSQEDLLTQLEKMYPESR
ncbi:MAG TPA: hypothetical protein VNN62_05375 [Methylomirabilota bacterium]|jgi:predicted RNase H-like nuclease (RuvC/YqgF family)|nr:hypothetical protein [Methylomirabilota bacterium]